jgi:serine/threonine protein kinase, bacterial
MATSLGSRYVLQEALGRGAMGQVFAASIRPTGEPVAVKILRPELVSDPEVVARFVQERTILMSIADPNVVRVIDLVVEGDTLAIVMELVRGSDLRRQLRDRRTVPPAEALHLTGQLLRGMAAVHAAGIIHRDIKPENVLVDTASGRPQLKLTDFGVARLSYGASLTKLSGVIGTPEYMAPELTEHNRATPAADVYSAGIVLYEMLCGRTPFGGGHPLAVLRRQADQAPPVIPGLPAELWAGIAWMLAKDPGSRPASAAEAHAALAPLEASLASWPALAPWAGPEGETPFRTVSPAGYAVTQDGDGPARHGTVLRHRDRGEMAAPGDAGAGAPRSGAGGGLLAGPRRSPASPPSRRKRQARMAVLAVAVAAVLGLVTTVAMAATHRPDSLRPAADGPTTPARVTASSAGARVRPTGERKKPASIATVSPGPTSVSNAFPSAGTGSPPQPKVIIETVTGSAATTPSGGSPSPAAPQSPASSSPSLSTAEQQLAAMLNPGVLDNCTGRPDEESGDILAAVNCSYVTSGPTLRPLAETLAAGTAETWFQDNTSGFTNNNDCPGGQYVGTWSHLGSVAGQLGCTIESNGLLRIVWVVGNEVGVIAEGSSPQALWTWWKNSACLVKSVC